MDLGINISNQTGSFSSSIGKIDVFHVIWQSVYTISVIVSNVVVLYVFIFKLKERTYSNLCFISLALCDLVVGLVCFPSTMYSNNISPDFNYYLGIYVTLTGYAQPSIGFFILLVLTVHRFFQLTRPAQSTEKLTRKRKALLVGIWMADYSIWLLVFILGIHFGDYDSKSSTLQLPWFHVVWIEFILYIVPVLSNVILIIATIFILLVRNERKKNKFAHPIAPVIKSQSQDATLQNHQNASAGHRPPRMSRDAKAVLFLATMVAVILTTQSLFIIIWPLSSWGLQIDPTLSLVSEWLSYSNSLFNPVVLLVFHEQLKLKFKETFTISICILRKRSEC